MATPPAAAASGSGARFPLLTFLAAVALLPAWLGLAGDWHWTLDLFAHFRWQYLAVSVAALAWALWQRARWLAAVSLLTLLLNAALVASLALQPQPDPASLADDFALRVLNINVLGSNPHKQAVVDYIVRSDADIVFLAEVDDAWAHAIEPLGAAYPYRLLHPRPDNFGLALLSRVPLEAGAVRALSPGARPSAVATVLNQGRRLLFVGTHPPPPTGAQLARIRNGQIDALGALSAQSQMPVIAVGDFNATPWSAPMRRLAARGLRPHGRQPAWQPTWMRRSPLAIPIDHVLTTSTLWVEMRQIGPDLGSDHRPVLAQVRWREGLSAQK